MLSCHPFLLMIIMHVINVEPPVISHPALCNQPTTTTRSSSYPTAIDVRPSSLTLVSIPNVKPCSLERKSSQEPRIQHELLGSLAMGNAIPSKGPMILFQSPSYNEEHEGLLEPGTERGLSPSFRRFIYAPVYLAALHLANLALLVLVAFLIGQLSYMGRDPTLKVWCKSRQSLIVEARQAHLTLNTSARKRCRRIY